MTRIEALKRRIDKMVDQILGESSVPGRAQRKVHVGQTSGSPLKRQRIATEGFADRAPDVPAFYAVLSMYGRSLAQSSQI
jgi:hypothetical protein